MKKVLPIVIAFVLIACAPQATVTAEVTITLTPPPSETLAPAKTVTITPTIVLNETVVIDNVSLTLGAPDANGWSEVTDTAVVGDMSAEEMENKLEVFDPGFVGFAPDEAKLVYNADGQKLQVVNPAGEAIAVWNHGAKEMVWDYDKMFVDGENVLFRIAKTWEMNGVAPVDMEAAKADSRSLEAQYDPFRGVHYKGTWLSAGYLLDGNGDQAIGVMWVTKEKLPPMEMDRTDVSGDVFFLDANGEIIKLKMKNMDGMTRFWQ